MTIDGPHSFRSVHLVGGAVDALGEHGDADAQARLDGDEQDRRRRDEPDRRDGQGLPAGPDHGQHDRRGGATGARRQLRRPGRGAGAARPTRVYGDYADPDDWGSGGGPRPGIAAPGGGLVRVTAGGSPGRRGLADGAGMPLRRHGGSGGGIYVAVATSAAAGSDPAGSGDGGGGRGGGGRVAVYAGDYSGLRHGPGITAPGGGPTCGGGAGTVYLRDTDEPAGTLVIDAAAPGIRR